MNKYTIIALAVALLSGCATNTTGSITVINPKVATTQANAEKLLVAPLPIDTNPVSYSDASWIPLRRLERSERDAANLKADNITIEINQRFASLSEVAGMLSSQIGMPVAIDADVSVQSSGNTAASASTPSQIVVPSMSPSSAGQSSSQSGFNAYYTGNLTGFMNTVAAYYGVNWKTEGTGLRFFSMDSKTYRIAALPGDTSLSASVTAASNASAGGAASGATQSGNSANSTGTAFSGLSVWTALESSIKQMLSSKGKVVASPATGTLTVTDIPSVLARVTDFVADQNQSLNRLVSVNVRVLSVEVNDGEDYGINWDAVYASLASSSPYTLAVKTAFPMATGAGNLVLSAPATSASNWAGSSAMISALSTQGRVSELTSATMVTLNNQPAPVNVGRRITYLASSTASVATVGTVAPPPTLTPGTLQTGFSMTLIPHILDGHELLLQYSIDISSLMKMNKLNNGSGSQIDGPDVSTSNFIQRVRLQSGETLVVAGFDQDNLSAVASGVGDAQNPVLGNRNGATRRSILVVMIQPNLVR